MTKKCEEHLVDHDFLIEKLHCEKKTQNKLSCLNVTFLYILLSDGLYFFEINAQEGKIQDPLITFLSFKTFIFGGKGFPTKVVFLKL